MDKRIIGVVAPSGQVDKEKCKNAFNNLEKLGFCIKYTEDIFYTKCYLAGNDENRQKVIQDFFADPQVGIIMAARGGYGAIRLINKIDYDLIRKNPKPFVGFSDITALLLMIYKKTGMVTYHGPMICSDFSEVSDFTSENFYIFLHGEKLEFEGNKIYREGSVEGIIWGGNLATVVSLCGQDFIPDKDFIFFAEDLNEPVYKIDRMFTQLFNIEKFKANCKGIVLGDFLDTDNQEWLEEFFYAFPLPTAGGFKITHAKDKITIPIGKKCNLERANLVIY